MANEQELPRPQKQPVGRTQHAPIGHHQLQPNQQALLPRPKKPIGCRCIGHTLRTLLVHPSMPPSSTSSSGHSASTGCYVAQKLKRQADIDIVITSLAKLVHDYVTPRSTCSGRMVGPHSSSKERMHKVSMAPPSSGGANTPSSSTSL